MESIGEDVVGWWAKAGWQSGLAEKLKLESACAQGRVEENKDDERPSSPSRVSTPDNIQSGWDPYPDATAETSLMTNHQLPRSRSRSRSRRSLPMSTRAGAQLL
ncbi:hypothetical protein LB505_004471 [Fusarium chuoi]|nr:hypothetical protein LB505_004471 [Fusarium chuoi]